VLRFVVALLLEGFEDVFRVAAFFAVVILI